MTGGSGLGPKANAEVRVTLIAQSWRLDKPAMGLSLQLQLMSIWTLATGPNNK